jgi:manganese/zinc/iron transport system permease protein
MASAFLGHVGAIVVPGWFGYPSTLTAGTMAVAAGCLFGLAALLAPRHGIVTRLLRRRLLSMRILTEDVIAVLYRWQEEQRPGAVQPGELQHLLMATPVALWWTLWKLNRQGDLRWSDNRVELTHLGRQRAQALVRSHRLWEHYLATEAGVASDRIHEHAERLEHFTDAQLRRRLSDETSTPDFDPHGRPIPPEHP